MMSNSNFAKLVVIGAISLFCAGAYAMEPSAECGHMSQHSECGCMQKHEGHGGMMQHHNHFPWMLKMKLGLTGKQAGEISDIMKEEQVSAKPLFEAIQIEQTALMRTARSGDQAAIKAQATKLADAIAAMAVQHGKVHKRIAAVMTKEQVEMFDKMSSEKAAEGCPMGHDKNQKPKQVEHHHGE